MTLIVIAVLAAVGAGETVYLISKRRASERPVCPIGGHCEVVLGSKYNRTLGVHNDSLGLLFYVSSIAGSAALFAGLSPVTLWANLFRLALVVGSVMSAYFTYLQWRVIKAWCFWCLMSALTVWAMTVVAFAWPLS